MQKLFIVFGAFKNISIDKFLKIARIILIIKFLEQQAPIKITFLKTKIPKNLIVHDKFLSDNEVVFLIKNCKAIIMPYKSASQSGIPPLAYALCKPIIASNYSGVIEYIKHEYNGLIYKDDKELDKMINFIFDEKSYNRLEKNIKSNSFFNIFSNDRLNDSIIKLYKQF